MTNANHGLLLPKTYIERLDSPLIFLAGPIRGASDWQSSAAEYLLSKNTDLIVATPRRESTESLSKYKLQGRTDYFNTQRAWERHYLEIAAYAGCIMFWLPGETDHECKKSYGAMTRLELGQAMTEYRHDKDYRFVIGSDGKFSELDIIKYDLKLDAPDKKIFTTLEETCDEAIKYAFEQETIRYAGRGVR